MKWIKVFSLHKIAGEDFVSKVNIQGKTLCIVKEGEEIFAVQNKCPHAGADLSRGWCRDGTIICPYHRHEFDLKTGRGKGLQGNYIKTYPVEIRPDGVYVGLKESWWKFW